jgi:hypothetical protein
VTGMQTAKLKAESQGRKAKVKRSPKIAVSLEQPEIDTVGSQRTNSLCNSLPIHIMSYWSMYRSFPSLREIIC